MKKFINFFDIFIDICIYIVYTESEVIIMEAKLQKWGNSDGLRIPSSFLKALNLKTNDIDDKALIFKPS